MKCGGCFHNLSPECQENVLATLRTLKDVCRYHRGKRNHESPYQLLVLATPLVVGQAVPPPESRSLGVYLLCQVSLSPLDLCLWKCIVTEHGVTSLCEDFACPNSFSATLDYVVHTDSARRKSQTCPNIQTMHQFAFSHHAHGISNLALRFFPNYDVLSLCTLRVNDANRCFRLDGHAPNCIQDDAGDDGVDEDDPRHEVVNQCLSVLRAFKKTENKLTKDEQDGTHTSTKRAATDEPRMKQSSTQRKRGHPEPTASTGRALPR